MSEYDLIVIGGGSAGLVAAAGAAHLGARVLLVEKKALGGDCLFTGCVPSKTFIRSARFAAESRRAEEFGFAAPDGGEVRFSEDSFASITKRVARVIEKVGEHDAPERFRAMGVEIIFGTPRFLNAKELEIDFTQNAATATSGKRILTARRFFICTGSRPAVPSIEGLQSSGFLTNEEVFAVQRLPRSLAIIGGGAIGVELGQAFARFGSAVTIIEAGERLLPKEDEEVSASIEHFLRAEKVNISLETKVVRIDKTANGLKKLTLEHEGTTHEVEAEEVLVATGREINVEGLNLEAAGVRYDKQCIYTDAYLRTTAKHIFAAGDVTNHFQFTHMAAYEASIALRNALLFRPLMQKTDFSVVPWATFTDPEIARVGMTEKEARNEYGADNVRVYRTTFADNDRANTEEAIGGFCKLVCAGRKDKLVGAHIVGASAGELIHEAILAMKMKLSITALGSLIHVYPTLSQVNQQAALDALLRKLASYRKLLSYYFAWRR